MWHILKISAQKVFTEFAPYIFASAAHSLNQSTVLSQPKLTYCLTIFEHFMPVIPEIVRRLTLLSSTANEKYFNYIKNFKILFQLWIPLILDYGYALASRNFDLALHYLPDLMILNLQCKSWPYAKAIYLFLSQLNALSIYNEDYFKIIGTHFDAFLEEKNETMLSFLARSILSHTRKKDFTILDRKYKFLNIGAEFISNYSESYNLRESSATIIVDYSKLGVDTKKIFDITIKILDEIDADTWKHYAKKQIYCRTDSRDNFTANSCIMESIDKNFMILEKKIDIKLKSWL
jgi:hypothetical protein